jgi:hypothetical protein
MTDKVFADNAEEHGEPHLRASGYRARSEDEVRRLLTESMRIDPDALIVLPRPPGEKTGHVDSFVLAVDGDRVMVPQIRDEAFGLITYDHEHDLGRRVQRFLDDQAATIAAHATAERPLIVDRLPMLPPVFLTEAATEARWHGVFYTPANSLLVDLLEDERFAFVPTFDPQGFPDAYRSANLAYVDEWRRYFEDHDFTPVTVDATALGRAYGLVRCVTSEVPR